MAKKKNVRQPPVAKGTDWPWVWQCVAGVWCMTLLAVVLGIFVYWLFYTFGWIWHVSSHLMTLIVALTAFVPPFIPLWRLFTFHRRHYEPETPSFSLRLFSGILMAASLINVAIYARDHFTDTMDVKQITAQTPLDRLGRINVKQLRIDARRGVGITFRTSKEYTRYRTYTWFHCYVLVPIKGRKNDYRGIHLTDTPHRTTSDKRMSRHWNEFVERSRRIIGHYDPEEAHRLKRVNEDFDVVSYRLVIRNTFGKQADSSFTVWEAEEHVPYPLTTHLLWGIICLAVLTAVIILILSSKAMRREDRMQLPPLGLWWRERQLYRRLPLIAPPLLMVVYILVGEMTGIRLGGEDPELLVRLGGPVRQLMEQGEWWRLVAAPFFPYTLGYTYFFVLLYGIYAWFCELRQHPYFLFAVYWLSSVFALLVSMAQLSPDDFAFIPFSGLFGVLGSHICILSVHIRRHPPKAKRTTKLRSPWQRLYGLMFDLALIHPFTSFVTFLSIILLLALWFTDSYFLVFRSIAAILVGMLMGLCYTVFFPTRIKIESDKDRQTSISYKKV